MATFEMRKGLFNQHGIILSCDNVTTASSVLEADDLYRKMNELSTEMKSRPMAVDAGVYMILSQSSDVKSEWFLFYRDYFNFNAQHQVNDISIKCVVLPEGEKRLKSEFYLLGYNDPNEESPTNTQDFARQNIIDPADKHLSEDQINELVHAYEMGREKNITDYLKMAQW